MNTQPAFVSRARAFATRATPTLAFRLMRLYFGCTEAELAQVAAKVYAESCPENTYGLVESKLRTNTGLLLYPFFLLAKRSWLWRPQPAVDWNFETLDGPYFERWFRRAYDQLKGSKRITPRAAFDLPYPTTRPHWESVRLSDILKLFLLSVPMTLSLLNLGRKEGLSLLQAARQMVSIFTVFHGYFTRYPCRHFATYDDEWNPTTRRLAFRRRCSGSFVVIQNGERNRHPRISFGLMDAYVVFGPAYEKILRDIGTDSGKFESTGALCLNFHHATLSKMTSAAKPEYDVLFIDQGIYPHNGLNERSGRSIEVIMERLGELARKNPKLRVAYQLRKYYDDQGPLKTLLLDTIRRRCGDAVQVVDNADGVESYRSCLKSELVMTFESTLGFEALRLGRKTLFVNFSGDPAETLCSDARFQHVDDAAAYEPFEKKVLGLLSAPPLPAPPEVALERHPYFDGQVQDRLAAFLNTLS